MVTRYSLGDILFLVMLLVTFACAWGAIARNPSSYLDHPANCYSGAALESGDVIVPAGLQTRSAIVVADPCVRPRPDTNPPSGFMGGRTPPAVPAAPQPADTAGVRGLPLPANPGH